jgi:hypothetical protein
MMNSDESAADSIRVEVSEGEAGGVKIPRRYSGNKTRLERFNDLEELEQPFGHWNELQIIFKHDHIDVDINRKRYRWAGGVQPGLDGFVAVVTEGSGIEIRSWDVALMTKYSEGASFLLDTGQTNYPKVLP